MDKIGVPREQQAYERYVKYCESIDVTPAPFDRWQMYEQRAPGAVDEVARVRSSAVVDAATRCPHCKRPY